MLTTYKRDEWKENPEEEKAIDLLTFQATADEVRKLFPFRVLAKKRLLAYGIPEGELLSYARARHEPQHYPILAIIGLAGETKYGNHPRKIYLSSEEAQLVEA
jgi:hypothetical protein